MIKAAKVLLSIIVPGTLSVIYWFDRYPFIYRELSLGDLLPVWFIAAVIFLTPFLIILGVAAIDKFFHSKEGYKLTMSEAIYKVILASTPLVVNAIALLILDLYNTGTGGLGPFRFFMSALMLFEPILGGSLMSLITSMPAYLGWLIIEYGAAWTVFFLIYAKLSKIRKKRLRLALAVIPVFVTVVEGVRMGLVGIWIT